LFDNAKTALTGAVFLWELSENRNLMKKNISTLLILLAGIEMLFAKDSGNWKKYESMKKDDYSVNENFWKKYKGISKVLSEEIPADKLYEVTDNYVFWIVGNSYGEEMHEKLMKLPEIVRYSYLVYSYETEINNGGFDQFFFNSIGYEVFEIQKALDFFGLTKNKEILDKAVKLLETKITLSDYKKVFTDGKLPTEELEDEFNELDGLFMEYPEKIESIINTVLDKNREKLVTNR